MDDLTLLVSVLRVNSASSQAVRDVLERLGSSGNIGELLAKNLFAVQHERAISRASFAGRFGSGKLAGQTVKVTYNATRTWQIPIGEPNQYPNYYLVFAGPKDTGAKDSGRVRQARFKEAFLFEAAPLIQRLREQGTRLRPNATSVKTEEWEAARIYPGHEGSPLRLTSAQEDVLGVLADLA